MARKIGSKVGVVTLVVALLGSAIPAAATPAEVEAEAEVSDEGSSGPMQDEEDSGSDRPAEPPPTLAGPLSKLQVHGFLTQAWATASFQDGGFPQPDGSPPLPTDDELVLGIPEDGTTDYRFVAIQFRYQMTDKDIMIIQLSSRALGDSSINEVEDEIDLDWAFYERRLADHTSLKVGRIPISFGIFNEVRDVGTILPFYRPAFVFYREGSFTNETVDGINLSHTFGAASDWSLDTDVYFGEWDSFDIFMGQAVPSRVEDSYGFQLWLNTPVSGLRWGLGFQHREITEGLEVFRPVDEAQKIDDWFTSVDAVFERFVFRAEYRTFESDPLAGFGATDLVGAFDSYYGQFGYHATEKARFYLQREQTDFELSASVFTETQRFTARIDWGFAFNYAFTPALVLKAEYHIVEGEASTFVPVFVPTPPFFALQPIYTDLDDGDYSIISLSASF